VHGAHDPGDILVVTSDRLERETITAAGAQAMSCANFLELLSAHDAKVRAKLKHNGRAGKATLGDIFPSPQKS
jgi:predicted RNA-binding protein with PIN domain